MRASAVLHKVQVNAQQAAELEKRGAKVLADYGSFKLMHLEESVLSTLPAEAGVELRDDYNNILLNAGTIDTASERAQSMRGIRKTSAGKSMHLVQFSGPVRPEWYKALEETGVQVVTYIPNNTYLVYGDSASLQRLQNHMSSAKSIQWDGEYLPDYKLDPSVNKAVVAEYSIQLVEDSETNAATLALIAKLQSRENVSERALGYVNIKAAVNRDALDQIVQRPDVVSVQPYVVPVKLDERQNRIISGAITGNGPSGPGYLAWLASKGFTQAQFSASGFGVDVTDSGLDNGTPTPNHFGLYVAGDINGQSRVIFNRLEGTPNASSTIQGCDGHGTLNSHIVGGFNTKSGAPYTDAAGYSYGLGVAPFVKLGSSVVFDPGTFTRPNYPNMLSRGYRDNIRISSNSWGSTSNAYTADSQTYDGLVRDAQPSTAAVPADGNQEMVIAFAAGNSGSGANTVGSPSTAKNVITVGASENVHPFGGADNCAIADTGADNLNDIISFSSRGPTSDGRKKPDIVAPGTHVTGGVAQTAGQKAEPPAAPNGSALSCFDGSGVCGGPSGSNFFPTTQQWYSASSGTSHSTPAVAGGAALVRQYFINQGMAVPSPAMTKAYLMNSARYLTGVGANDNLYSNSQGMGLMDLGMAFDGTPRKLEDQATSSLFTATGQTRTFAGSISDSTKPFRVTLAWTDAPGATSGAAYKNNLDLTVTVGTTTYKGNVFTKDVSTSGGSADLMNNVESVYLPAGVSGPFTVTVTATNINSDGVPNNSTALDQDFALVVYNACNTAPAAPTGVTATVAGDNRISVSFTENGASSYNIYRAKTAGGPYTRVGTAVTSPFVDTEVSGGGTYYYVVRGVLCAESPNSNEASATATGVCKDAPTFEGLTSASNAAASTCSTTLSWSAAQAACGGSLTYSVYRSTTAGFTPSAANRIATGITGTTFSDNLNLTSNSPYFYVVRATEVSSATNEDKNTVQRSATPTGSIISGGATFFDNFDGSRPANASAYWTPSATAGSVTALNIVSGCHYQSATNAYRFGATNTECAGSYANSQNLTLALGGDGTVSPSINGFNVFSADGSPTMTFNLWYAFEARYDGAWLVYSTTGANGPWINVNDAAAAGVPYISAGGYDNTLQSSSTTRIWTSTNSGANGSLKAVTVNLSALNGQKVWFGFRFYSDSITVAEGMYVDDVRITSDSANACTTNTPPAGAAVSYRLTGLPAASRVSQPIAFSLTAYDNVGQVATGYSGTAALTELRPGGHVRSLRRDVHGGCGQRPLGDLRHAGHPVHHGHGRQHHRQRQHPGDLGVQGGLHRSAGQRRGGRLARHGARRHPGRERCHGDHGLLHRHAVPGEQPGWRDAVRHDHGDHLLRCGDLLQPVPEQDGRGLHPEGDRVRSGRGHQLQLHHLGGGGQQARLPHPAPGDDRGGCGDAGGARGGPGQLRQRADGLHGQRHAGPDGGPHGRHHRHPHGGGGGRRGDLLRPDGHQGGHGLQAGGERERPDGRGEHHLQRDRGGHLPLGHHEAADQHGGGRHHHPGGRGHPV
ncbi:S8 family serine peptidase [Melittangium boletus]|uniref:S8 family serine peptidase n=1 Tax=Melittangium boletus TaxID=83453 RepID=UPI003DA459CE